MSVNELVVGNLNCIFPGQSKFDLLDFWDEYVKHVFLPGVSLGTYDKFILYETHNLILGANEPAIVGRFVKDTEVQIQQGLEDGKLVEKHDIYPTAPSAVFVYLLRSHTILYSGEHRGYPNVLSFRRFLEKVLGAKRKEFLSTLNVGVSREEKIANVLKFPPAMVSYVPFPSGKSLVEQLEDVQEISGITIHQYLQNGPFKTDSFIKGHQTFMEQLSVGRVTLSVPKPGNVEGAKEAIAEIARGSESEMVVNAKTAEGKKKITNDGLQFRKNIPSTIAMSLKEAATKIYENFRVEVAAEELAEPQIRNPPEKLGKVTYE